MYRATVDVGSPPRAIRIQGWYKNNAEGKPVITSHAPAFSKTWTLLAEKEY